MNQMKLYVEIYSGQDKGHHLMIISIRIIGENWVGYRKWRRSSDYLEIKDGKSNLR